MATERSAALLGPDDDGRELSADEFAEAASLAPFTFERSDGSLLVMSPEGQRHLDDSWPWRQRLSRYWIEHPEIVEDVVIQSRVQPDSGTDRIGDIGVYLVEPGAAPIPDRVPDLMVEVVSPSREDRHRDHVARRRDDHRLGGRDYVIVDRPAGRVSVLTAGPRGDRRRALRRGAVYRTPFLPGLEIAPDEVL